MAVIGLVMFVGGSIAKYFTGKEVVRTHAILKESLYNSYREALPQMYSFANIPPNESPETMEFVCGYTNGCPSSWLVLYDYPTPYFGYYRYDGECEKNFYGAILLKDILRIQVQSINPITDLPPLTANETKFMNVIGQSVIPPRVGLGAQHIAACVKINTSNPNGAIFKIYTSTMEYADQIEAAFLALKAKASDIPTS